MVIRVVLTTTPRLAVDPQGQGSCDGHLEPSGRQRGTGEAADDCLCLHHRAQGAPVGSGGAQLHLRGGRR